MSENNIIKIDAFSIGSTIFSLSLSSLYSGFFLKFYIESDDSIKYNYSSILLLILITSNIKEVFKTITKIFILIKHYNLRILNSELEKMTYFNNKIIQWFYILMELIAMFSSILCVPIFIPYTKNNCHEYSYGLCVFGRISAFGGVICIIFLGLTFIFISIIIILYGPSSIKITREMSSIPVIGNLVTIIELHNED